MSTPKPLRSRWAKPSEKEVFEVLHSTPSDEADFTPPVFRVEVWNRHDWVSVHDECTCWQGRLIKRGLTARGFTARICLNEGL